MVCRDVVYGAFPSLPIELGNVPLAGGFNPSQQGGYAMPYTNQSLMGDYAQYPYQTGSNPQQGM